MGFVELPSLADGFSSRNNKKLDILINFAPSEVQTKHKYRKLRQDLQDLQDSLFSLFLKKSEKLKPSPLVDCAFTASFRKL
jgi:hypothetical protein